MNAACFCDYDPPEFYYRTMPTARLAHKCSECGKTIRRGEKYERVNAKWGDRPESCLTCARCLALRDYVTAHVPCVCWEHHRMIEGCIEAAQEYAHEAPGLLFGARRREVLIYRGARYDAERKQP